MCTSSKVNEPAAGAEHNPPVWPDSVTIIDSNMSDDEAQKKLNEIQEKPVVITRDMLDKNIKEEVAEKVVGKSYILPTEHFSKERKAVFFEPRAKPYKVDFQVGYYVQALGLGASAADVKFADASDGSAKKGPYCPAYLSVKSGATLSLDTFWRSAENFTNETKDGLLWAVSQAAPLRRVHATGNLMLHDNGAAASGGHIANAEVDGSMVFGSQQQYCARSITVGDQGSVNLGAWSNVFVDTKAPEGCLKAPQGWPGAPFPVNLSLETRPHNYRTDWSDGQIYPDGPSTTVSVPKTTVEKCFVAMKNGKYVLHVPKPRIRTDGAPLGADLSGTNDDTRDFEQVYVAKATSDNEGTTTDYDVARKINMALSQGKDVVLSPGTYELKESIHIVKDNQVLLGVGMATLQAPESGETCIRVAPQKEGVRIGGIMFAASNMKNKDPSVETTSFIEFGTEGVSNEPPTDGCFAWVGGVADPGNPSNPGVLTDLFCRVGGGGLDREVSTDVMVRIHSGNVIGDNLWLWRADHTELAKGEEPNFKKMGLDYHQVVLGECPGKTGLEVNGDNVVIHGLAVEHTTEDQVIWNGHNGEVYFYQCELPYDVDKFHYTGFRANGHNHTLGGAGVYCNFRDHNVAAKTGIVHPSAFDAKKVINPFTVHLNNKGQIMTVVSDGRKVGGGPVLATYNEEGKPAAMISKYLHPHEQLA